MSEIAAEVIAVVERLPQDTAQKVLKYARQLAEEVDDAEWDRISSEVVNRESFKRFVAEARVDVLAGNTEPLNVRRL